MSQTNVEARSYQEARGRAQALADELGFDFGVERHKVGKHEWWSIFMLPSKEHRFGFELRCEVVHCTILEKCKPGHGP